MTHKVLVDLKFALMGHSGIPQDSRLLFNDLAQSPTIDVAGLIMGYSKDSVLRSVGRYSDRATRLIEQDELLLTLLGEPVGWERSSPLARGFRHFQRVRRALRFQPFTLTELDVEFLRGFIWRRLFSLTLDPSLRASITSQRFFVTSLSVTIARRQATLGLPLPRLDTRGFTHAIFQDSTPVAVSPGTHKLIRYHDALPLIEFDTMVPPYSRIHYTSLAACARDSFFVCNSDPTRADLINLFPHLEERSVTIPYGLPQFFAPMAHRAALPSVLNARRSLSASAPSQGFRPLPKDWDKRYVLAVSTIEPRKNFLGLISAWERVRYETGSDLRLVIVGTQGWKWEDTLSAMRPHIRAGTLIHLDNVSPFELTILYSNAEALVSVTFNEGFGFPPMEAAKCDCPAIVSDIPAHRWVMGDGALYCDPYDVRSIADALKQLTTGTSAAELRRKLLHRAHVQAPRFDGSVVRRQWLDLFETLSRGKAVSSA